MTWLFSLFLVLDLLALLACSRLLVTALQQRKASHRPGFILLVIAVGFWALFTTLAMISQEESWYIFWRDLVFAPLSLVPPLLLMFMLDYTGHTTWLPGRQRLWLFLLPALTQLVLLLNPVLGWLYKDTQSAQVGIFRYTVHWGFGLWYYVHAIYSYSLILASLGLTVGLLLRLKSYQRYSALLLFFAILIPFLISIPYTFQWLPPDIPDPNPLALAIASVFISQAIRRHRLLDLLPIDRSTLFDLMADALIALDWDEQVVDLNPAAERVLGLSMEDAQGKQASHLLPAWGVLRLSNQDDRGFENEIELEVAGEKFIFRLRATPLRSHAGELGGWLLALNDITQLKHAQAELLHLATTDPLTGLANRRHFFHHAAFEMSRADRYGHAISVLMIDLDDFKLVNDRLGHAAGDRVLAEVTQRMRRSLRQVDLLARYGGEEFVALLPESNQSQSWAAALRLHSELTSSMILIEGQEVLVTASIGVATRLPGSGDTLDELLHRADRALYQAKQAGKNCVRMGNGSS